MMRLVSQFLNSGWGVAVTFLAGVAGAVVMIATDARPMIKATLAAWLGLFQSIEVVIGSFVMALLIACLVIPAFWVCNRTWHRLPLAPILQLAEFEAMNAIRRHMDSAIILARPIGSSWTDRRLWNELTASSLRGYSHSDVISDYCQNWNPSRPLIFCNFRGYAHAVKEVLDAIPQLKTSPPYPIIWTLLKRPIFDWYNPFSVSSQEGQVVGKISLKWWEEYKDSIVSYSTNRRIRLHRIVAHPPVKDPAGKLLAVDRFCLFSETALELEKAKEKMLSHQSVKWLPSLAAALDSPSVLDNARIHLIGDLDPPNAVFPRVVNHFANRFHNRPKNLIPTDEFGVFVRYLKTANRFGYLLTYDDLFVVNVSKTLVFGLAYIDEKSLDIQGMRILPQHQLCATGLCSSENLLSELDRAWRSEEFTQDVFCVCTELPTWA